MGDDAELYIESGGDPTTLIEDYYVMIIIMMIHIKI